MASGLPVITCPIGGISEVVEDGGSGLLIPPGDVPALDAALTRLLSDGQMRLKLGERGRRLAEERYDARRNVARIVQIMHEIV